MGGILSLASCSSDRDSNPTLNTPESFELFMPSLSEDNIVDLEASKTLKLNCSQPDYGYTAAVTYKVEVSTKEDMSKAVTLPTIYTKVNLDINSKEIGTVITKMLVDEGKTKKDFPAITPVHIRIKASIDVAETYSNTITLPKVRVAYTLPEVKLPKKLHVVGNFCNWEWSNSLKMVQVHSTDNVFWSIIYAGPETQGFKLNTKTNWDGALDFDKIVSQTDNIQAVNDNNIGAKVAGWYTLVVKTEIIDDKVVYNVSLNEPKVYLMGETTKAWEEKEENLFTVPQTDSGSFVSPEFKNDSDAEVRAYVKINGYDWWKSEFMVFNKKLEYRGTGNDQERVTGKKGQRLYINFLDSTGEIK